jgi:hypothetical protein
MSTTIREHIAAWLATTIDAVAGATVVRPKRIHWIDNITIDQTVVITQAESISEGQDDDAFSMQQDYDVSVILIDSDDVTDSIDTRINAFVAAILEALFVDPSCGGYADAQGLLWLGSVRLEDQTGTLTGEIVRLRVKYSMKINDFSAKGY